MILPCLFLLALPLPFCDPPREPDSDTPFSLHFGLGAGGITGEGFDSDPAVSYGVRLKARVKEPFHLFLQDRSLNAPLDFDFINPATGLSESDREHLTVHSLAAGLGITQVLGGDLALSLEGGLGGYLLGGAHYDRRHITGQLNALLETRLAPSVSLNLDLGLTLGSVELEVDDWTGRLENTWNALAGFEVRW